MGGSSPPLSCMPSLPTPTVSPHPSGWLISLSAPLKNNHEGLGPIRAEVALLNRTIVIQGTDEPAPYQLEGEGGGV